MLETHISNTYSNDTLWLSTITSQEPAEITQSLAVRHPRQRAASYVISSFVLHPMENIDKETNTTFAMNEAQQCRARRSVRTSLDKMLASYDPHSSETIIRRTAKMVRHVRRLRASAGSHGVASPFLDCAASLGHMLVQDDVVTFSSSGDVSVWVNGWLLYQPNVGAKPLDGHVDRGDSVATIGVVDRKAVNSVVMHSAPAEPTQPLVTRIDHLKPLDAAATDFAAIQVHF